LFPKIAAGTNAFVGVTNAFAAVKKEPKKNWVVSRMA
jgi:hypothetical protein